MYRSYRKMTISGHFYALPQKVLRYYVLPSEILSVHPSIRRFPYDILGLGFEVIFDTQ